MARTIPILSAVIVLSLGACATNITTAPATSPAAAYELPHVKRPNLVVADLDRSLKIYRDTLRLTASEPSVSGANSFSYPVFKIPRGTPMRSLTLSEPGEERVLALTEVHLPDLPRPSNAPHMSAVVIGISDLAEAFEKLEALGLETTETRIAEGADFRFIEQAFVDYDGHLIVCYEILSN